MKPTDLLTLYKNSEEAAFKNDINKTYLYALLLRKASSAERDSLTKLRGYAEVQLTLEILMEQIGELLKAVQNEYKDLTETIIPEMMEELGIPLLALSDTQQISIKDKVTASLSKERSNLGCEWLEEHGHGAIVKHQIVSSFGTREREKAAEVVAVLKELGIEPEVNKSVHHSTLSAWVRGQLEEGNEIPMELFGVYRRKASTITEKNQE